MNCQCTTAAFTVSHEPEGFVFIGTLASETRPCMRFLYVGSHLCTFCGYLYPVLMHLAIRIAGVFSGIPEFALPVGKGGYADVLRLAEVFLAHAAFPLFIDNKLQRGSYRPRPALRVFIPKADGTEHPLSILCLEDKIVQQAVVKLLEGIYEEDFPGFSYGFRPGRSQHDAMDALNRHSPVMEQAEWLKRVLQGHLNYFAVPGNSRKVHALLKTVRKIWYKALKRRSQRNCLNWNKFGRFLNAVLPKANILHPWPEQRFDTRYSRQEPYALVVHVRICAGGAG